MLNSPVDVAMIVGVALLIFGPSPPRIWKVETNEKPEDLKRDPFEKEKPKSFLKDQGT